MTVQDKEVESFAESFYKFHGALAPDFGCETKYDSDWEDLTSNERKRLVAAARLALMGLGSDAPETVGESFHDWPSGGTEGRECGS
jgi:hypothetical protein